MDAHYANSYEDFKSMGLEGAARQVLLEGLAATDSAKLRELARRDGIALEGQGPYATSEAPAAEALEAFRKAQAAHAAFVEAPREAWQARRLSWPELKAHEEGLRRAALEAFGRCKALLKGGDLRPELLRAPLTPELFRETREALAQGAEEALRALGEGFEEAKWSTEGPGRLLEQGRRMAELDALPSRAKELAQKGPGTLNALLAAIGEETSLAVQGGCKEVLVLGGHGISGVRAARAGAHVVLWEPLKDVAAAAEEVLRRNLEPEQLARCLVVSELPSSRVPCLVVVDRWHGLGVFGWSPLEALRHVVAQGPVAVVPGRLRVALALGDGGLTETQGFDLAKMDERFRNLAAMPLKVGVGDRPHPTSLQPKLLTGFVQAFDYDLEALVAPVEGPKAVAFSAKPSKAAANCAVFEVSFELSRSALSRSLRFAQWLPGGLQLSGDPKLAVWRNEGRVWLEWDAAHSAWPPFGFMALSEWYFEMLRDGARHRLYESALELEVKKIKERGGECKVLDVGSGDGILSLMASRAGASKVLGVEYVPQLALASRQVLEANRPLVPLLPDVQCSDVRGLSEAVEEQRFELLVTELMDASGLGENLIVLTEGSKRRLCRADSPVIPARLRLKAVLCQVGFPELGGVKMDAFWPFWPLDRTGEALWIGVDLDKMEGDFKVLTEPVELFALELGQADADAIPNRATYHFSGLLDGTANMVVWWFEAELSAAEPAVVLSNEPGGGRHAPTCWGQAAAEVAPVAVRPGHGTEIRMEMAFGDYQLKFKVPGAAGPTRFAAPPNAPDYSLEYREVLEDFARRQQSYAAYARSSKVGHTAVRTADVEAVAALQRCVLCMALFPTAFGLEASTANRLLMSWYAVGGEGRS